MAGSFFSSMSQNERRPFIVLDRDGTIIEEREYLAEPEQVKLIPGVGAALRELKQMGFGLVVITNQSGVGRGLFDEAQLKRVHERLCRELDAEGVHLDGLYVCPHTPDDDCCCRKPKLGLIQKAAEELGFSLEKCIVIGDKASDIEMGHLIGALTFLVRTGYGAQVAAGSTVEADYVADNLGAAAVIIRRLLRNKNLAHSH
jgi:D-glycero-D-manno-heptose 1,7-bisphosphate phosphatase